MKKVLSILVLLCSLVTAGDSFALPPLVCPSSTESVYIDVRNALTVIIRTNSGKELNVTYNQFVGKKMSLGKQYFACLQGSSRHIMNVVDLRDVSGGLESVR